MPRKKKLQEQETVSICTVVSFGRSSRCALKIAMVHTVGSVATVITLGDGRRGGTNFTPNQTLKKMFVSSGHLATGANMEIGNKAKEKQNEQI
jgi:hypothetical protein